MPGPVGSKFSLMVNYCLINHSDGLKSQVASKSKLCSATGLMFAVTGVSANKPFFTSCTGPG